MERFVKILNKASDEGSNLPDESYWVGLLSPREHEEEDGSTPVDLELLEVRACPLGHLVETAMLVGREHYAEQARTAMVKNNEYGQRWLRSTWSVMIWEEKPPNNGPTADLPQPRVVLYMNKSSVMAEVFGDGKEIRA